MEGKLCSRNVCLDRTLVVFVAKYIGDLPEEIRRTAEDCKGNKLNELLKVYSKLGLSLNVNKVKI